MATFEVEEFRIANDFANMIDRVRMLLHDYFTLRAIPNFSLPKGIIVQLCNRVNNDISLFDPVTSSLHTIYQSGI